VKNANYFVAFLGSLALVGMFFGTATETRSAVVIGAGTGIPKDAVDTSGPNPRTNVDESFTQTLPRGTYRATDFSFAAGQTGDVKPFLGVSTGSNQYSVLALGDTVNVAATGTQTVDFGGSDTFILPGPTTVHAGITNPGSSQNPVYLDNGTTTTTDHDGSPTPITTAGQTVGGFSHPGLDRTYAFDISVAQATLPDGPVYYDNFDGSGAADLNGTAPDVRPGPETWTAADAWKADGSKSSGGTRSAWLPLVPDAGKLYTLSLDVNPDVSGSSDWFALGFNSNNLTDQFHDGGNTGFAWLLNRENDASSSVVQTFLGGGTSGAASHDFNPDKVGFVNLKVQLDTRDSAWTAEWFVDGSSIRGPVAFGSNPTINYVGFGAWSSATGAVDNFRLMVTTPEPATLLVWSLLAGLSVALPWRRRRR